MGPAASSFSLPPSLSLSIKKKVNTALWTPPIPSGLTLNAKLSRTSLSSDTTLRIPAALSFVSLLLLLLLLPRRLPPSLPPPPPPPPPPPHHHHHRTTPSSSSSSSPRSATSSSSSSSAASLYTCARAPSASRRALGCSPTDRRLPSAKQYVLVTRVSLPNSPAAALQPPLYILAVALSSPANSSSSPFCYPGSATRLYTFAHYPPATTGLAYPLRSGFACHSWSSSRASLSPLALPLVQLAQLAQCETAGV